MILLDFILGIKKELFIILIIVFCFLLFLAIFLYFAVVFVNDDKMAIVSNIKGKKRILKKGIRFILPLFERTEAFVSTKEIFVTKEKPISFGDKTNIELSYEYSYIVKDPLAFYNVANVNDVVLFALKAFFSNHSLSAINNDLIKNNLNEFLDKYGFEIVSLNINTGNKNG